VILVERNYAAEKLLRMVGSAVENEPSAIEEVSSATEMVPSASKKENIVIVV
jgi:hypothetical protein